MKFDTILLADAVSTPGDGKFYIHGGGFSRVEISGLPAPIPISVFARFRIEDGDDATQHRFRFSLIGPAGVPNVEPLEVMALPPDNHGDSIEGEESYLNVSLQIPAVAIREGIYRLQVELDGELVREVPLPVLLIQEAGRDEGPPRPKNAGRSSKRPPPPPRKKHKRRR